MRARRAQARLCGREFRRKPTKPFMREGEGDARKRGYAGGTPALPGSQTYPCKPFMGEGAPRASAGGLGANTPPRPQCDMSRARVPPLWIYQ